MLVCILSFYYNGVFLQVSIYLMIEDLHIFWKISVFMGVCNKHIKYAWYVMPISFAFQG